MKTSVAYDSKCRALALDASTVLYIQVSRLVGFLSGGSDSSYGSHHLLWKTTTTRCSDREVKAEHAHSSLERDEIIEKLYSASKRISGLKVKWTAQQLLTVFHIIADKKYFSCSIYFNFLMYILYFDYFLIRHPRIHQKRATGSRFRSSFVMTARKTRWKRFKCVQWQI